ncbi:HNH endonuclease [Peribacillus loiseleuriae]|uniref:HNH nuclease domain-containing protein n=1 Tax=Peribacillus loiseleuriae TaxID=1679170 RepID=A0A0K9GP30_9BACI|nr:HNH endonuclease [Peribacillus loiseleuriae]KMY48351.1 hypothetical protein AC625_01465 [Peribacillus loiseleuriae]
MEKLQAKNEFSQTIIDGKEYIKFVTGGKYKVEVIVDKLTWERYLHKFHWTALCKDNYHVVKTSINKHSVRIHRMIVENEYNELDYWGNTVDHINKNSLDNRKENLRIYNSKLNSTNTTSKYSSEGLNLIYPQRKKKNGEYVIYGYKVHTNVFDTTIYKNFSTVEEAISYRDNEVLPLIEQKIEELKKKTRDIEFERGLRDKLINNEINEVRLILEKYGTS